MGNSWSDSCNFRAVTVLEHAIKLSDILRFEDEVRLEEVEFIGNRAPLEYLANELSKAGVQDIRVSEHREQPRLEGIITGDGKARQAFKALEAIIIMKSFEAAANMIACAEEAYQERKGPYFRRQ